MSPNKRKTLLNSLLSSHLACSCGSSRPNHHDVFQPRPRPKPKSTSSSSNDDEILTTFSPSATTHYKLDEYNTMSPEILSQNSMNNGKIGSGSGLVPPNDVLSLRESVMVVKDSEDPYKGFRDSSPNSTSGKIGSGPGPGPRPIPRPVPPSDVLSLQGSMVVVKDSKDPYKDFRDSMLQMINENKIFSKEDLHHLLRCFLRLNSPTHHHYILHAFFQIRTLGCMEVGPSSAMATTIVNIHETTVNGGFHSSLEQHLSSVEQDYESICWGCGLRLILPSNASVYKCGWCGAITKQDECKREHKLLRWKRLRDRCFVAVLLIFMVFVTCGGVWAVYPFLFSKGYFCGLFHCTVASILGVSTLSMFSLAAICDPGRPLSIVWGSYPAVRKDELRDYTFCHYCSQPKPPRAHHCSTCGMCVLDMDHHCPFIGNCVGAANHRYFVSFLIVAVISVTHVLLNKRAHSSISLCF
ncbi:hypothetical protein KSS87_018017 [Heliosperma pusillum]|nr:hypothetical protein KSS87_018017 [Heliosperma pusillum]